MEQTKNLKVPQGNPAIVIMPFLGIPQNPNNFNSEESQRYSIHDDIKNQNSLFLLNHSPACPSDEREVPGAVNPIKQQFVDLENIQIDFSNSQVQPGSFNSQNNSLIKILCNKSIQEEPQASFIMNNPQAFQKTNLPNNLTQSATFAGNLNTMEVEFQTQQYQFQQQQSQQNQQLIRCPKHTNKSAVSICFSKDCQSTSRLLCSQCLRDVQHLNHKIIDIEDITTLDQNSYLPIQENMNKKLAAVLQSQPLEAQHSPEKIQNLTKQLEEMIFEGMKKTFKEMMVSVQKNNDFLRESIDYCHSMITERFTVDKLHKALFQYLNSNKQQNDQAELDQVLKEYAETYSMEDTLSSIIPQNNLTIDPEKFNQAYAAFKEGFNILSEAVIFQAQTEYKFQQPTYLKAQRYVQLLLNDSGVICSNKLEPIAVIGESTLEIDRCYTLTFLADGIKPNLCWGAFLVKSKYVNHHNNKLSDSLCWPTPEKGVFCCFDGDCSHMPNSLNQTGAVKKLEGRFIITIHIAERIFKIRNEFGNYSAELYDQDKISADGNYYLGFALTDCKLVNLPWMKNNDI